MRVEVPATVACYFTFTHRRNEAGELHLAITHRQFRARLDRNDHFPPYQMMATPWCLETDSFNTLLLQYNNLEELGDTDRRTDHQTTAFCPFEGKRLFCSSTSPRRSAPHYTAREATKGAHSLTVP